MNFLDRELTDTELLMIVIGTGIFCSPARNLKKFKKAFN